MFQKSAFQPTAFQFAGAYSADPSGNGGYAYVTPYQKYRAEEYEREKIKKDKTELEKLESVLLYNQRQAELAAESKKLADLINQTRLAKLENDYLTEVARLLAVKAELIRRIRQSEQSIIFMAALKRKRLRAVNSQAYLTLVKT
ncbi:hypothetical protein UFOVP191_7 [uncultured Caudovirales phage]|uniref:Uncharacterized protein n=1 Tax=uncultured Caudovirales phage TaxID=2100421 RepID=A0A6J7WFB5_9CAUD|nr:hypothetical protein UFOVP191_7 [uncultured Caudovirales phage]